VFFFNNVTTPSKACCISAARLLSSRTAGWIGNCFGKLHEIVYISTIAVMALGPEICIRMNTPRPDIVANSDIA
jgi:hypothetical protein